MEATLCCEVTFDAGHIVSHHPKCSRPHGHTYVCRVRLSGTVEPKKGWVLDFGELKRVTKEVVDRFDHRFIVSEDSGVYRYLKGALNGIVGIPGEATAENIAQGITAEIEGRLDLLPDLQYTTLEVELFEGRGKSATIRRSRQRDDLEGKPADLGTRQEVLPMFEGEGAP